jgi:hypothetical protein
MDGIERGEIHFHPGRFTNFRFPLFLSNPRVTNLNIANISQSSCGTAVAFYSVLAEPHMANIALIP